MNIEKLHELFRIHKDKTELEWIGNCKDCGEKTSVLIELTDLGFKITGGAIYEKDDNYKIKCEDCFNINPHIYQKTLVYSRVVGYLRPVDDWNVGKQAEFKDRKAFDIDSLK